MSHWWIMHVHIPWFCTFSPLFYLSQIFNAPHTFQLYAVLSHIDFRKKIIKNNKIKIVRQKETQYLCESFFSPTPIIMAVNCSEWSSRAAYLGQKLLAIISMYIVTNTSHNTTNFTSVCEFQIRDARYMISANIWFFKNDFGQYW